MIRLGKVGVPAAVILLAGSVLAADRLTTVVSPVISYQLPDDFSRQAANSGGLVSPIASYVYFDWAGDDILRRLGSPVVSYLYIPESVGPPVVLRGTVLGPEGEAIVGAVVSAASVGAHVGEVTTGESGGFEFPPLPPDVYQLSAAKQEYLVNRRVLSLAPATSWQSFHLASLVPPPSFEVAGSTPSVIVVDPLRGAKLRAYGEGEFLEDSSTAAPGKMTVVLTHGWKASVDATQDAWPQEMARALRTTLGSAINILAWDWQRAADTWLFPPIDGTPGQGVALARALRRDLGPQYALPIHFIGHSLGTLVNARAANFLHGVKLDRIQPEAPYWPAGNTHLTLLDEAEVSNKYGRAVVYASYANMAGQTADRFRHGLVNLYDTVKIKAIPESAAWIDNYISGVGLAHAEAVNVCLQESALLFNVRDWWGSAEKMHGYAVDWYRDTVLNHGASQMGFVNSAERARGLPGQPAFPPPIRPPAMFHQNPNDAGHLEVLRWTCDECVDCYVPALNLIYADLAMGGSLAWPTSPGKMVHSGSVTASFVVKHSTSIPTALARVASRVAEGVNSTIDLFGSQSLRLELITGPPSPGGGGGGGGGARSLHDGEPEPLNTPAYAWITVDVLRDADSVVFDFTTSGDPRDDALTFAINDTNLFTLPGKFMADGASGTSPPIDVRAYAGSTNAFFFGVTGGTSTNYSVVVDGVRFYTSGSPLLSISSHTDAVLLTWPTSAPEYRLETTADLGLAAWSPVTNAPAIWDRSYVVTNVWTDETRFFRLRQE